MTLRTEEEDLAMIREWWQRNGKPLMTGCVLALVLVFGWKGWQNYQTDQAQNASMLYQQLLNSMMDSNGQPDLAQVASVAGNLQQEFPGTPYAQYGSLFMAKLAVEAGKLEEAQIQLQGVLDKPADATLEELARQRLARVQAAMGKVEEELKGDLLVQLGRTDDARVAYEQAKLALSSEAAVGGVQMKLDDLAKKDE